VAVVIYIFDENAGVQTLELSGEQHKYLIKVRRHTVGDELFFRNRANTERLYSYKITALEPRTAVLELEKEVLHEVKSQKELHIAWCVIDPKSVEKVLPSLCEIGVSKISFVMCQRSQKNFLPDFKRLERIAEASMQQSGRTSHMAFDSYKNIAAFVKEFPDTKVFDFCENVLGEEGEFKRVLIGCEGGFSKEERELLQTQEVFRLNTEMVLRSESAVVAVAAKILL
jgi:16S rRNA (uracil1498-N3)-methyltransferase